MTLAYEFSSAGGGHRGLSFGIWDLEFGIRDLGSGEYRWRRVEMDVAPVGSVVGTQLVGIRARSDTI